MDREPVKLTIPALVLLNGIVWPIALLPNEREAVSKLFAMAHEQYVEQIGTVGQVGWVASVVFVAMTILYFASWSRDRRLRRVSAAQEFSEAEHPDPWHR